LVALRPHDLVVHLADRHLQHRSAVDAAATRERGTVLVDGEAEAVAEDVAGVVEVAGHEADVMDARGAHRRPPDAPSLLAEYTAGRSPAACALPLAPDQPEKHLLGDLVYDHVGGEPAIGAVPVGHAQAGAQQGEGHDSRIAAREGAIRDAGLDDA